MSEERWQPPIKTGREGVLIEGFPPPLRESLLPWVRERVGAAKQNFNLNRLVSFQAESGVDLGFRNGYGVWGQTVSIRLRAADDVDFVLLISWLLWQTGRYASPGEELDGLLDRGSSKWRVFRSGEHGQLTERVPAGTAHALEEAMASRTAAGRELEQAYVQAFGVNPSPSDAYANAVVAVEIAAFQVMPLNVAEPTLANLFSVLEAENAAWQLILRDSEKAPGAKAVAAMLRTLWRGHDSRHGSRDYKDTSIEQARAAVLLASTLVWWFENGVVVPVAAV